MGKGIKALVVGSSGLLGSELVSSFKERDIPAIGFSRAELDITDEKKSRMKIAEIEPVVVVNCAGYTRVDRAEEEPELAFLVNCDGARYIARAARKVKAKVVYISTDYVFDGEKRAPYSEEDEANPLSVYGRSKAEGERGVISENPDHLIIRTSWLYGVKPPNFVLTILEKATKEPVIRVVSDQLGSPTYAHDLAECIIALIEKKACGTYHFTNSGETSWYRFALKIVEIAAINKVNIVAITSEEAGRKANRPRYSVLDLSKVSFLLGRAPRRFEEALADFLSRQKNK
jgi:dTDP-4-dehydrorhamnose reductase